MKLKLVCIRYIRIGRRGQKKHKCLYHARTPERSPYVRLQMWSRRPLCPSRFLRRHGHRSGLVERRDGLTPPVRSFERDFSNGYLFGKLPVQPEPAPGPVRGQVGIERQINNFSLLEPLFRSLCLATPRSARSSRVGRPWHSLVRDLKIVLEKMASRPTAVVGRPRNTGSCLYPICRCGLGAPSLTKHSMSCLSSPSRCTLAGRIGWTWPTTCTSSPNTRCDSRRMHVRARSMICASSSPPTTAFGSSDASTCCVSMSSYMIGRKRVLRSGV